MKVAIVHDWLTGMRGGERCLDAFLKIYPQADIFTLVHIPGSTNDLIDSRVKHTSFLNRIPGVLKFYRHLLPLFPLAIRSFNFTGYDLVISLSHAAAKNVRVPKGVPHLCYCFTPMRYIWDQAPVYFKGLALYLAQPIIWPLRLWDRRGSRSVSEFVAISSFIAARIRRFYGRRASVIPPPVRSVDEVKRAKSLSANESEILAAQQEPFFLCAGALVPYKRVDVAVDACSALGVNLWVLGGGSELESLKRRAGGSVRFFGRVSDAFLWECYSRCQALLFPGIEDFGIVPVECLASGRPVIAIQGGGVGESLRGVLMNTQKAEIPRGTSGVFVPKSAIGSSEVFAQAISYFLSIEPLLRVEDMRDNAAYFYYREFFKRWGEFSKTTLLNNLNQPFRAR
jgi:glycosyltransferase involved in cell wall biosynthesis